MAPLAPIVFQLHTLDTKFSASSHTFPSSMSPRHDATSVTFPLPSSSADCHLPLEYYNSPPTPASLPPVSFPSSLICLSPDELSRKAAPCSTSQSLTQQIFIKTFALLTPNKSVCVFQKRNPCQVCPFPKEKPASLAWHSRSSLPGQLPAFIFTTDLFPHFSQPNFCLP